MKSKRKKNIINTRFTCKNKKKGGVRITPTFTQHTAFIYFIENSKFSIFSQNGVSCITICATLAIDPIKSPYRKFRLQYMNKPVTTILFKLFSLNDQITTEKIINEINIQQDLFFKSMKDEASILEPLCPALIYTQSTKLSPNQKSVFYQYLSRDIHDSILSTIFETDIAYIAMEFMNEYKTLKSLERSPNYNFYKFIAFCELDRMHRMGYMHNDFHFENVLIHESYHFLNHYNGRAIIIDFGLSESIPIPNNNKTRLQLIQNECGERLDSIFIADVVIYHQNHAEVQKKELEVIERICRRNIRILLSQNLLVFYRMSGGGTSKLLQEEIVKNRERLRKLREDNPSVYGTFPTHDEISNWFLTMDKKTLEKNNPDSYRELMEGINGILEMEKTDPDYLAKLVQAQTTGLLIKGTKVPL